MMNIHTICVSGGAGRKRCASDCSSSCGKNVSLLLICRNLEMPRTAYALKFRDGQVLRVETRAVLARPELFAFLDVAHPTVAIFLGLLCDEAHADKLSQPDLAACALLASDLNLCDDEYVVSVLAQRNVELFEAKQAGSFYSEG